MILNFISFIIIVSLLGFSIALNVFFYIKTKKLNIILLQTTLDKSVFAEKLSALVNEKESQSVEKTDGFLKFVSQSRDWAFQYIEEVQSGLVKFDKAITKAVEDKTPKLAIKDILEANKELQKLLPEETEKQGETNE